jgi:3-dehydroquinate synthase
MDSLIDNDAINQANNYPIHFNEEGYKALKPLLKENKYSNLFIIVDSNTNEFCLPNLPL